VDKFDVKEEFFKKEISFSFFSKKSFVLKDVK